ncbi:MAG: hypothetical protein KGL96_10275, partial [Hyphomicrobiales bacterium]|nr:hypothetical protein [Hyphomicrobiales bacterium]
IIRGVFSQSRDPARKNVGKTAKLRMKIVGKNTIQFARKYNSIVGERRRTYSTAPEGGHDGIAGFNRGTGAAGRQGTA